MVNKDKEMKVKVVRTYTTEKTTITVEEDLIVSITDESWFAEVTATKLHLKVDSNEDVEIDELHQILLRTILKQGEV